MTDQLNLFKEQTMYAPKQMASGRYIDLATPHISDIDIRDIAVALSEIKRFTGHYKKQAPLSVLQHTWLTAEIAQKLYPDEPEVVLDCVMHDWAEAYVGDVSSPLKRLLNDVYRDIEGTFNDLIYAKYWVDVKPYDVYKNIRQKRINCDLISMDIERQQMWDYRPEEDIYWPKIPNSPYSNEEEQRLFNKAKKLKVDLEQLYMKWFIKAKTKKGKK